MMETEQNLRARCGVRFEVSQAILSASSLCCAGLRNLSLGGNSIRGLRADNKEMHGKRKEPRWKDEVSTTLSG